MYANKGVEALKSFLLQNNIIYETNRPNSQQLETYLS